MKKLSIKSIFLLLILTTSSIHALEITESLRLDGYSNITGIKSQLKNSDSFSIDAGVQGRYQVSEDISITGHLYFKEANNSNSLEDYEEDLKWFYADYYLGNEFTLRAGKFQFPIFTSSEVGTIGYSRTWTENPISSYGAFGYDNFTGAELLKNFFYDDYDFTLQFSYGTSENELQAIDNSGLVEGEANSIRGLTLKTSNDWLMINIGYMRALSNISYSSRVFNSNVAFNMYALETEANFDDFSLKTGFITAKLSTVFPDEQRYYLSLEYNYDDITPYIYYSNEKLNFKTSTNNPKYETSNEVENYSLGIRYDISRNTALKLSYTKKIENEEFNNASENENENNILKCSINVLF